MPTTRREFLGIGASGLSFVSLGAFAPGFLASAAEQAAAQGANDHVLVVVELSGGNDGLNTLVPFEDPLYYQNRKTLGLPREQLHRLSDQAGLHPALEPFAKLFAEGELAVVQGVGYPEPDRSHFRSMEIWHTASVDKRPPSTGWLGRVVDTFPRSGDLLPSGLAFTGSLPQAFLADRVVVPVVGQVETLAGADEGSRAQLAVRRKLTTSGPGGQGPVAFLRQQSAAVYKTADRLKEAAARYKSTVEYPGSSLGGQLRRAAQILSAGLGVRVVFVSQDGYDTHSAQADQHSGLLSDLATSLAAFHRDLAGLGLRDRVLSLVFSEFGRRVDENASAGTDHGAASCLFVVGRSVKGGLAGRYPSLAELGEGDLIFTTDFRRVYASLLGPWLGCQAKAILGSDFEPLDLIKT